MARPKKENRIPNLRQAIQETAWRQIASHGAAALSLRSIARELGITAPAIYNYFPSRDDLVTALIVDAFTTLGDSLSSAIRDLPDQDLTGRIAALGRAYREWALAYPQRYQLIFGTPLPNYVAPAEITVPAASGALIPLAQTLQSCFESNRLQIERLAPPTPALQGMLADWSQSMSGLNPEVLYIALVFWSRVHGLVSLEIGQQLPTAIRDPGEVFRRELLNLQNQYFDEGLAADQADIQGLRT